MVARTVQRVAIFAIAMLAIGSTQYAVAVAGDGGSDDRTRLEAELMDPNGDDSGKAKFELRPADRTRLSIEIEDVGAANQADCDKFTATIKDDTGMTIFTSAPGAFEFDGEDPQDPVCDLNLDDRDGETVPTVADGDMVTVTNGVVTLTGNFGPKQ